MDKTSAKKHILETCGPGWLNLVDIVYDNKPEGIEITEVFQKWAGLKVDYEGENEHFEELTKMVYYISEKMCEICGKSGGYTVYRRMGSHFVRCAFRRIGCGTKIKAGKIKQQKTASSLKRFFIK